MHALTEPHFESAALLTIDVQRDTLAGAPLEIPGTSAAVPQIARLRESFRRSRLPRWGAFFGTSLTEQLVENRVDTVVVTGCNFPNCPRTSIYEASERDFRILLVEDAMSG